MHCVPPGRAPHGQGKPAAKASPLAQFPVGANNCCRVWRCAWPPPSACWRPARTRPAVDRFQRCDWRPWWRAVPGPAPAARASPSPARCARRIAARADWMKPSGFMLTLGSSIRPPSGPMPSRRAASGRPWRAPPPDRSWKPRQSVGAAANPVSSTRVRRLRIRSSLRRVQQGASAHPQSRLALDRHRRAIPRQGRRARCLPLSSTILSTFMLTLISTRPKFRSTASEEHWPGPARPVTAKFASVPGHFLAGWHPCHCKETNRCKTP